MFHAVVSPVAKTLVLWVTTYELLACPVIYAVNLLLHAPLQCQCCTYAQDDFFWKDRPQPCEPSQMPTFDASHELNMKRKRDQEHGRVGGQHGQAGHGQHDAKRSRHNHAVAHPPAAGAVPQPNGGLHPRLQQVLPSSCLPLHTCTGCRGGCQH